MSAADAPRANQLHNQVLTNVSQHWNERARIKNQTLGSAKRPLPV